MTDSVQLKLRQRANLMLNVYELAESYRPEADKAMTPIAQPRHGSAAGRKLARRLMITAYRTARV